MMVTLFDGAMGTMLMRGFTEEEALKAYVAAGADVITANTFAMRDIARRVMLAKTVAAHAHRLVRVALDIGPLDEFLEPAGELEFDDAVELLAARCREGAAAGVDLIVVETMTDLNMAKAAVTAAKLTGLPVYCTLTFGEGGRTLFGDTAESAARQLSGLGVDALGANCSLGPRELVPVVSELLRHSNVPVMVQPNAGLPEYRDGETVYSVTPQEFAKSMLEFVKMGVSIVGGCCGTTPEHIRMLRKALDR